VGDIIRSKTINGNTVNIVFILDKYYTKDLLADWQDFVAYQTRKEKVDDASGLDFKFYDITQFTPISFEQFAYYSVEFLSKIIFNILQQSPHFITSNNFTVQVKFIRVRNRESYFAYVFDPGASDAENVCTECAGVFLMQAIVAPWIYLKKIDYAYVAKFFIDGFAHNIDNVNKMLLYDARYKKKIALVTKRKYAACVNYMYRTMFDLREEGFPDFMGKLESDRLSIDPKGFKEYNAQLVRLANLTNMDYASKVYREHIGYGNQTSSGEYACGRMMCTVIAMSIAKAKNKQYRIKVDTLESSGSHFPELDRYLADNKTVYVRGIDSSIIDEAVRMIRPTAHYYFIKLYETACRNLGISEKNMVMTARRFYNLVTSADTASILERKKELRSKGFNDSFVNNVIMPNPHLQ
jgi:hypothetical protein